MIQDLFRNKKAGFTLLFSKVKPLEYYHQRGSPAFFTNALLVTLKLPDAGFANISADVLPRSVHSIGYVGSVAPAAIVHTRSEVLKQFSTVTLVEAERKPCTVVPAASTLPKIDFLIVIPPG